MDLKTIAEQLSLMTLGDLPYRETDKDKIIQLREVLIDLEAIVSHAMRFSDECAKEQRELMYLIDLANIP